MALTPSAAAKRYSPLIILAAVQLVLVALAPSTPPKTSQTTALGAAGSSADAASGGTADSGAAGGAAAAATDTAGSSGSAGAASGSGSTAGGTAAGGAGGGAAAGGSASSATAAVDRSHCDANGRQVGVTFYMPPCAPVWHGGDNGGATMTGVSATPSRYVVYVAQGNPEVNQILNAEGLAATPDQVCAALQAFDTEVNKRFEFYGRKMVSVDGPGKNSGANNQSSCHFPYFQGQCSLTPPDPPCERAEADLIAQQLKPAYVIVPVADPALSDELAKDHVVFGGGYLGPAPDSYHQADAPYYWDFFTNGDRTAKTMAEYYCKKLWNKPVKYAGVGPTDVIKNPTAPPKRKIGIVYPATNGDPTIGTSANLFIKLVTGGMCGAGDQVKGYPYQSDITTAQTQSTNTIAQLKSDGVTTVTCICDPIAPVFFSNTADQQGYHPEIMLDGTGVLDYDVLGQLYNKNVWRNAFGISDLGNSVPFASTDAVKAYNDAGFSGQPDGTENTNWSYYNLMATSFQEAGPKPTPQGIESGMFNLAGIGGDPIHPLELYGHPNDFTGIRDAREVFWCNTAVSPINGQPGTYIPVDGGKRYQLGQWPSGDPNVFTQTCG